MACSCRGRSTAKYVWIAPEGWVGQQTITYTKEIQAKAKVLRDGGTYEKK